MNPLVRFALPLHTVIVACGWAAPPLRGEPSIQLIDVPKRVAFPMAPGSNEIITAVVHGGAAQSVWLTVDGTDSSASIPLVSVGEGRYQINLAVPEVHEFLRREGGTQGQFRIIAELEDGTTIAGVPVAYTMQPKPVQYTMPLVKVTTTGNSPPVYHWGKNWFDPEALLRLEVEFNREAEKASVRLVVGNKEWPVLPMDAEGPVALELTPEIREAWKAAKTMNLRLDNYDRAGIKSWIFETIPTRLELPKEPESVTVHQRSYGTVPGSRGYLTIRLGDITGGQVRLAVLTTQSHQLGVKEHTVSQGDVVRIDLKDERYVLVVEKLVNFLIGDDYAVLKVVPLRQWEHQRIERLLEAVESAEITFIRHGQEYSGKEAAEHMRLKLRLADPPVTTLDEFIDNVASRSSLHNEPYFVKLSNGTTEDAAVWLRHQPVGKGVEIPDPDKGE